MSKKLKKNVPELRFPNSEGNWKQLTLKEIASKITDGTHDTPKPVLSGVPFLTAIHIKDGYIDFENCYYLPEEEHRKIFTRCNPEYGDILMVNIGAGTATVARIEVDFEFSLKNVALIKIEQGELSSSFVFQSLSKNSLKLRHQLTSGGAQPFFSLKQISKLVVNLPKKEEQEKIARFLGAVDTRLTQLRRKHELLQTYKRGVMQKIFSQQIRFKCDDGKPFPDWEKKKLGEIASRQVKKNLDESITRVLTNSAVQGVVDQQDYFDKDIANADNLAGYYIIEKGDYVYNPRISTSAPVGPIHKNKIGLGVMSPLYTVFRFKTKEDAFYEQFFKTSVWHKYMCSVANYGARYDRMNITTSDFMALPLPYPISEEQEKIVDFLTAIDKKIGAIAKQIDLTEQFKKGLLQKMFV